MNTPSQLLNQPSIQLECHQPHRFIVAMRVAERNLSGPVTALVWLVVWPLLIL